MVPWFHGLAPWVAHWVAHWPCSCSMTRADGQDATRTTKSGLTLASTSWQVDRTSMANVAWEREA